MPGIIELVVAQIASDDRTCSGELRALHDIEPDPAAPDHQHAGASRDPGMADHRANPGRDAASDDCGMGERQVVANSDDLLGGTHDLFRKRPDARHLIDRFAVQLDPGRPVMHAPARRIIVADTQYRLAHGAVAASTAMRPKRKDDVVARLDVVDARAVLDDDPRSFVPEHHRQRQGPIPIHDVPVAHADAGRLHPDADLAAFRRLLVEIEYLQGFVDFHQNRGAHVVLPGPGQPDLPACRHTSARRGFLVNKRGGGGGATLRRFEISPIELDFT